MSPLPSLFTTTLPSCTTQTPNPNLPSSLRGTLFVLSPRPPANKAQALANTLRFVRPARWPVHTSRVDSRHLDYTQYADPDFGWLIHNRVIPARLPFLAVDLTLWAPTSATDDWGKTATGIALFHRSCLFHDRRFDSTGLHLRSICSPFALALQRRLVCLSSIRIIHYRPGSPHP